MNLLKRFAEKDCRCVATLVSAADALETKQFAYASAQGGRCFRVHEVASPMDSVALRVRDSTFTRQQWCNKLDRKPVEHTGLSEQLFDEGQQLLRIEHRIAARLV